MRFNSFLMLFMASALLFSCQDQKDQEPQEVKIAQEEFDYNVEEFADIKILRYQIPGWENLSLKEQQLVYYLVQAGLAGRDIIWDQNYKHNLVIREALENVYQNYEGDKSSEEWKEFETYLKRVWQQPAREKSSYA